MDKKLFERSVGLVRLRFELYTSDTRLISFNIILVIIDWLTKQVIFIPAYNTIISVKLA